MKKNYSSIANAAGVKKKDVPIIVRELKRIEKAQGVITPSIVVQEAENKKSALHRFFTWDDSVAAAKYREWQARAIIGCVQVKITDSRGKEVAVRAFVNVSPREDVEDSDIIPGRGYVSVEKSARNTSYQAQVLHYAKNQLLAWRRRFGNYKEFTKVVQEIDSL